MPRLPHTIKTSAQTQPSSSNIDQGVFVPKKELFSVRSLLSSLRRVKKPWSVDFFSLLQYREYIAGLAILEDSLAYMLYRSTSENMFPDSAGEQPLAPRVIVDGVMHDEQQYATALKRLFNNLIGRPTNSVVLSVLPHHIWMATLEFPKTLNRDSLREAIDLYFEFSIPFSKEESYIDWEILDDHDFSGVQRVEVGAIRKQYIDPYLDVLRKEGVTAIAVESHLMSVARCFGHGHTLFILVYPSGAHLGAYADQLFRFQRFVPWEHVHSEKDSKENSVSALLYEVRNVIHFLLTETREAFEIENIILVAPKEFRDSFAEAIADDPLSVLYRGDGNKTLDPARTVVRGAALRGLLPRKDDTIMSFTTVGTEKIYEWSRAVSFSAFFEKLAIGLGLFFIVLYTGSFFLVKTLAARTENRQVAQGVISQDIIKVENEAKRFNQTINEISTLSQRSPHWEKFFEQIARLGNPGITITSLSVDNPSSVALTGIAANRDALLQFRASINSSGVFKDIELPFTLLIVKENLPFNFSLSFRDTMFLFTP